MTVKPDAPGFYHCVSRCVRRAWLCGDDPYSGRNFDHRRSWIERRLTSLAESFSVGLYAWAVMSNHTHVVLRIDPLLPHAWSDEEVAYRWARLTPTLATGSNAHVQMRARQLLRQPEKLVQIRHRLGSLSWFMRFLNECIAREANAEDNCTGRFWEGRFKCQALLDENAVLACMAYVDLNPIRAGIADDLIDSDFTSIQRRLCLISRNSENADKPLNAMAGVEGPHAPAVSVRAYIDLVVWTGRSMRSAKHGQSTSGIARTLESIRGSPDWWSRCVLRIENAFGTAVGTRSSLQAHATMTGRRFLRGV